MAGSLFTKSLVRQSLTLLALSTVLIGCGGSAGVLSEPVPGNPATPLSDFRALLSNEAGTAATDCGTVAANSSTTTVDDCVATALTANSAFYAIYELNGIDSYVADGISQDAAGVTRLWAYDSSTTGQGNDGPVGVNNSICNQPVFSGGSGSIHSRFQCSTNIDQFQQRLQNEAGTNAEFCGRVEALVTSFATDDCVQNAFNAGVPFYAVFMLQGFDSTVADGITFNETKELYFWDYDSSTTGQGNAGPSRIDQRQCVNPVYSGGAGSIESRFGCYITVSQFQDQLKVFSGTPATDCGITEPGDDLTTINQCVAQSFTEGTPFYAVYRRLQGIESSFAQAISSAGKDRITLWDYSSGISSEGVPGPTEIDRSDCLNPEYVGGSGAVETIFNCQ